jgi:hypothetical protein
MVRPLSRIDRAHRSAGFMTIELVVAMGILASVMLPVAFSVVQEQRVARAYYFRAVAMEIVDGEMERLLAGAWRTLPKGTQKYTVTAESARNLPATSQFVLARDENEIRLEWQPGKPGQGGVVSRVARLPAREPLEGKRQ